jgi:hypothetical protein
VIAVQTRVDPILPSILSYWTELSNGYQLCLRQMHSAKNFVVDGNIELATARALHHQLSLVKWSALRYISAEGNTWQQAYHLYQFAEQEQFHTKRIALYDRLNSSISPEELLIQAAMLHLAQTDNLLPQEIEAIHLLLERLVEGVQLELQAAKQFQYVINSTCPPRHNCAAACWAGLPLLVGDHVVNRPDPRF